jgi:hypothetical protein
VRGRKEGDRRKRGKNRAGSTRYIYTTRNEEEKKGMKKKRKEKRKRNERKKEQIPDTCC